MPTSMPSRLVVPTHVAGVLVHDERGGVLLLRRVQPSQWETPGGKVEEGEDAAAAAVREACEELGAEVEITGGAIRLEFARPGPGGVGRVWQYDLYPARLRGPISIMEPERFTDLRFWRIDELIASGEPLSANVRAAVRFGVLRP